MENYDYKQAMKKDIEEWINDNNALQIILDENMGDDEAVDWISEQVWDDDNITGNGIYGYDTEEKCREYIASNLKLYFEAASEYSDLPSNDSPWLFHEPARHMDATIRCYLLNDCIWEVVSERLGEIFDEVNTGG